MTIPDELVEIGAKADAAFDGRAYDSLGRADRRRYFERHKAALTAVLPELARLMMEPSESAIIAGVHHENMGDMRGRWQAMLAAFFKERFGIEIKD